MRLRAALIAGFAALALAAPAQADTFTVTDGSSDVTTGVHAATTPARACARRSPPSRPRASPTSSMSRRARSTSTTTWSSRPTSRSTASARARTSSTAARSTAASRIAAGSDGLKVNHFTIRNAAAGQGGSDRRWRRPEQGGIAHARLTSTSRRAGPTTAPASRTCQGGRTSVQHSLIDGNIATGDGGGIVNVGGLETTPITLVVVGRLDGVRQHRRTCRDGRRRRRATTAVC